MILVPQRGLSDCGVACVAMVCEATYEAALRAIFGHAPPASRATVSHQLKKAIVGLDWRTNPADNRHSWDAALGITRGILRVAPQTKNNWHWVVWDGINKLIYDPYNGVVAFNNWRPFHKAPNATIPVFKPIA